MTKKVELFTVAGLTFYLDHRKVYRFAFNLALMVFVWVVTGIVLSVSSEVLMVALGIYVLVAVITTGLEFIMQHG